MTIARSFKIYLLYCVKKFDKNKTNFKLKYDFVWYNHVTVENEDHF